MIFNALPSKIFRKFWASNVMETLKNKARTGETGRFFSGFRKFKHLVFKALCAHIMTNAHAFRSRGPADMRSPAHFLTQTPEKAKREAGSGKPASRKCKRSSARTAGRSSRRRGIQYLFINSTTFASKIGKCFWQTSYNTS